MKAVRRFDPERGVRLVSFALHWIRAEIHEYILRNWRLVKIATTKAQRKLFFNLRSMKTGARALTPAEADAIAKELGVKPEEVRRDGNAPVRPATWRSIRSRATRATSSRRSRIWPTRDDDPAQILERAETSAQPQRRPARRARASSTRAAAGSSRRAGCARTTPATLQDLADEYGVSAERIRQIESKALKSMRGQMARCSELTPRSHADDAGRRAGVSVRAAPAYSSTCVPSSTTRLVGMRKKSVAFDRVARHRHEQPLAPQRHARARRSRSASRARRRTTCPSCRTRSRGGRRPRAAPARRDPR